MLELTNEQLKSIRDGEDLIQQGRVGERAMMNLLIFYLTGAGMISEAEHNKLVCLSFEISDGSLDMEKAFEEAERLGEAYSKTRCVRGEH